MKSFIFIGVVALLLAGCAKYPLGSTYKVTHGPGLFGYFLKEYELSLPEVALSPDSTHEWCFRNVSFNAGNPQFLFFLSADEEIDPAASGVSGSIDIQEGTGEFHKFASGPFSDPPGSGNTQGNWCSLSYSDAVKHKSKTVGYKDCVNLRTEISSWRSYCMRLHVSNLDTAMNGIKGHIVLQSSWK